MANGAAPFLNEWAGCSGYVNHCPFWLHHSEWSLNWLRSRRDLMALTSDGTSLIFRIFNPLLSVLLELFKLSDHRETGPLIRLRMGSVKMRFGQLSFWISGSKTQLIAPLEVILDGPFFFRTFFSWLWVFLVDLLQHEKLRKWVLTFSQQMQIASSLVHFRFTSRILDFPASLIHFKLQ